MHKLAYWAASFKMLLGQEQADYLMIVRHPVSTAISVYEKSGGPTANGRFPAAVPRGAIERWIVYDPIHLGYTLGELAGMEYIEAVAVSWAYHYGGMAGCGLFLGRRDEIRLVPYRQRLGDVPRPHPSRSSFTTRPANAPNGMRSAMRWRPSHGGGALQRCG